MAGGVYLPFKGLMFYNEACAMHHGPGPPTMQVN